MLNSVGRGQYQKCEIERKPNNIDAKPLPFQFQDSEV